MLTRRAGPRLASFLLVSSYHLNILPTQSIGKQPSRIATPLAHAVVDPRPTSTAASNGCVSQRERAGPVAKPLRQIIKAHLNIRSNHEQASKCLANERLTQSLCCTLHPRKYISQHKCYTRESSPTTAQQKMSTESDHLSRRQTDR